MEEMQSMRALMEEIRAITASRKSSSRVDEIRVMRAMLNDPDFSITVYDKSRGYIGNRCPRDEAVKFLATATAEITGLDLKSARDLANSYQFTKKDSIFMVNNAKDFVATYLETGRKLAMVQNATTEATLAMKHVPAKEKHLPGGESTMTVPEFDKVVCRSKSPKYNK